jgi:hypothetical protein
MKAEELAKAAQREIALRHAVYPQQVMRGKMKQTQVDHEYQAAQAWHILSTLAPQLVDLLEALAIDRAEGRPVDLMTFDLADALLAKLRTIVEP